MMELAATHIGRGAVACTADLSVPVLYGFLTELSLTCACRLMGRTLSELEPRHAGFISSFFTVCMVVLGKGLLSVNLENA